MSAGAKSLLIAGGGTGGHVIPAIAVAREWLRREPEGVRSVVIVGTERGMETRLVPQAGLPLETIRAAGLKGIGGLKLVKNAAKVPAGCWTRIEFCNRHKFGVAFGVGGYASGPMMLAARLSACRRWCSSQTSSRDSRIACWRKFRRRLRWLKETAERFGRKAVVTGNPVRKEFFGIPTTSARPASRSIS